MGDIVRLVEEAQSREAPVQRLADQVSGHFTYGVIALSAATFVFWNLFGAHVLPTAIQYGGPVSLALQLSCSVLRKETSICMVSVPEYLSCISPAFR